jgi:ribose transport system ATP-binding protein
MNSKEEKLLNIIKLNKSYPGVHALKDLDFDLNPSEIHCLVGENGAGKSTFIELLSGSIKPDSGSMYILGKEYFSLSPKQSMDIGIQTVHQESFLAEELTGAENIFVSELKTNRLGLFDMKKCFTEAEKLLESLNFDLDPTLKVMDMSPVEKKVLSITKAMWQDVGILILDEPTASLGQKETDTLLKLVRKIANRKIGLIYISHYIDEVFKIADRITVLKDGEKVGTFNRKELNKEELIKKMVGKASSSFYRKRKHKYSKPVFEVKNYSKKGVVEDCSFSIGEGEILGFGGMVGAGRTELMRLVFGLDKKDSGILTYMGKEITPDSPNQAIRRSIGFLTEDKKETGLVLERPLRENATIVKLNNNRVFFLNLPQERKDSEKMVDQLRIDTPGINQLVGNLSGGNQQKVVLAKWLLTSFDIIILDEPTKGIDVGAKEEIYDLIFNMAKEGKIIILISSDLEELVSLSDTICVMKDGKISKTLKGDEITREAVLSHAI